jgi:putative protein kinase ArgK-like GTPase of G3E family
VKGLEDIPASDLLQPGSCNEQADQAVRVDAFTTEHREQIVVGREPELAKLASALRQASESHGRLLFVTGEPGMGKSTLVNEFICVCRTSTLLI